MTDESIEALREANGLNDAPSERQLHLRAGAFAAIALLDALGDKSAVERLSSPEGSQLLLALLQRTEAAL